MVARVPSVDKGDESQREVDDDKRVHVEVRQPERGDGLIEIGRGTKVISYGLCRLAE
jgi:hypothetical protein